METHQVWKALQGHLASVFRNHNIQAIALLDPSVYTPPEQVENLSSLLNDTRKDLFLPEQQATARDAISSFLATVGEQLERAKYITQLGDGVFTYFSLTVEPGIARHFHRQWLMKMLPCWKRKQCWQSFLSARKPKEPSKRNNLSKKGSNPSR